MATPENTESVPLGTDLILSRRPGSDNYLITYANIELWVEGIAGSVATAVAVADITARDAIAVADRPGKIVVVADAGSGDPETYAWDSVGAAWIELLTTAVTSAANVTYDNTTSGLAATNVQAAIDEVDATLDATSVVAGAGLTGGGSPGAAITVDVVANADGSIVVNADDIQVGVITDTQHGTRAGGTTHAEATGAVAGFLSAADKTKLDTVTSGADPNAVDSVFGRTGAVVAAASDYDANQVDYDNTGRAIATGTDVQGAIDPLDTVLNNVNTAQLTAGAGLAGNFTPGTAATMNIGANADGSITINAADIQVGVLATDAQHGTRGGGTQHSEVVAGGNAGFISGTDKTKLDGIAAGAEVNTVDSVYGRTGAVVAATSDYDAVQVDYDNTTSGLTATDVQAAIDEVESLIVGAAVTSVFGRTGAVVSAASDYDAIQVDFDNVASGLTATTVQAAIDEIDGTLDTAVQNTTTITAGAGLTGGGDLSANRTIDVAANADGSITVNADDIQVGILATDAQHGVRGGGTQHAVAVASGAAGFLSGADKAKLDGVASGAEVNTVDSVFGRTGAVVSATSDYDAIQVDYDNTTSGLTATNAQAAIDEVDAKVVVDSVFGRTGAVAATASDYDAVQIDYDNTTSGLTATDAQAAIDEVDAKVVVDSVFGRTGVIVATSSDYDAAQVDFDNTTSGLTATNVQTAIDEIDGTLDTATTKLDGIESGAQVNTVDSVFGRTGAVVAAASDYDAVQVDYDNTTSGLAATDVQAAIDEVEGLIVGGAVTSVFGRTGAVVSSTSDYDAVQVDYDNSTSGLTATNTQAAIDEIDGVVDTAVQETRNLTAGAGLTGGGTLAADRTFDVVANADGSIVVNADDVQVGVLATDAQHGVRGGGTQHAEVIAAGASGFMSGADKTKLDGIASGAEVNAVDSVFGRTGAVVAATSDYDSVQIDYDNTTSGLTATNAQAAIDEVDAKVVVDSVFGRTGAVAAAASDYDAIQVDYDNTTSGLTATEVQAAIDEVDAKVVVDSVFGRTGAVVATNSDYDAIQVDFDNAASGLTATNVQQALDQIDALVDSAVQDVTTITAGAGLTGGGDLSANRTLDVAANADGSITVNADDIQVGVLATDAQHGTRGGGTQHSAVIAAGASGFMTGTDKTKLDGLANEAIFLQNNVNNSVNSSAAGFTFNTWNTTPVLNTGGVLYTPSATGVTVTEDGTYLVGVCIFFNGSVTRGTVGLRVLINGTATGPVGAQCYVRNNGSSDDSASSLPFLPFDLTNGDTIAIQCLQLATAGTLTAIANLSSFQVLRIAQ